MTCKDVREMIPLYYYEELEGGLAGAVRTHLASCADCREEGWGDGFDEDGASVAMPCPVVARGNSLPALPEIY